MATGRNENDYNSLGGTMQQGGGCDEDPAFSPRRQWLRGSRLPIAGRQRYGSGRCQGVALKVGLRAEEGYSNGTSLSKDVGRRPRHHFASSLILTFGVWATIDTAEAPAWA
jgi:hypothetical protein